MKKKPKLTGWDRLQLLIEEYADAKVADSWKGGGDPIDVPVIEATLQLARAKLDAHIDIMKREAE